MKKAALHLHAIPSDRRETRRVITPMQKTLYIIWPDGAQSEATIDSIQFGKMVIRLSKDTLPDCKVGSSYSIKGVRGAETIISGSWDLTAVREDGDFRLLIISHSTLKNLTYLSQYLDPIITLMSNRSRLFSFSDSAGEKWYSRHLTELKDCPVPIDARIWFGNRQVGCIFDFSSGSRELTSIDLVVLPEEKALLVSGLKTVLDYSFLGVRYLCQSTVLKYDEDFGILSLSVPDELLAVMARRFDRYHSNRMVHILTKNGSSTSCNLTELSASGGIVELNTDDKDFSHQNIIKLVTELGEVEIRPIRREDKRIAFQFSLSSDDDRSTLRRLFVDSLPHNIVPRKQEFYEQSIELYKNLGYGPKTPEFENSWLESNLQSWKIQDKILPGCSLLSFSSDRQSIASSGTLPMSRSVAYGHSFCMIKNLPAAIGLFEQMVTGLAWTELLSDIEYYGGSYAKHSGFTTRLHVISEDYPQPIGQIRVESVQFYPSPAVEDIETQSLYFSVPLDVATAVGNNAIPDPLRLLLEPHDILSEHHQKKIYSIVRKDNNRICAYAICQASPDLFTAVDLFNWSWVAVLEEHKDDFQSICVSVKKSRPFRGTVVVGIIQSGEESPPSASDGLPLKESFWLFTKKEDVGILFAAISRAIYTVVKKYGDSAAEELKNIC